MKCPECSWKLKVRDARLLCMHMELAHNVPRSVALTVLRKMGYNVKGLEFPIITIRKESTESTKALKNLLRKAHQ